jgi:hypothetical protein
MERFLTFDRLIAFYRNRLDVKPFPKDKLNMAYLDNKYDQFMKHLNDGDVDMMQKVIKEIYNQLQNGEEVYKYAIKQPYILDKIFNLLRKHEDSEIRYLSAICFKQFCMVLSTKEHLNINDYIKDITVTFDDEEILVRSNVYLGLIYYAQSRFGVDSLLENKILEAIIKKLITETEIEVLNLILVLHNEILTAETAPQISLNNDIVPILKKYLNSEDDILRENILLNYGSLSLCEEGKSACVEEGNIYIYYRKFNKECY